MTSQKNPLQAANSAYLKMRADYRAKRAGLEIEIKDDAYVDKASGLLNGPKLNKDGLSLFVNEWAAAPEPGISESVQMYIDRGDGNFVKVGARKEYLIPVGETDWPDGTFPSEFVLTPNDLPESAAVHFRFTHTSYQNVSTDSDIKPAIVELPKGGFPTIPLQPNPDYPACGAPEGDGSLRVAIPDLTGKLTNGAVIIAIVTPMKGEDLTQPEDPIIPAIYRQTITLGNAGFPVTGF